MKPREREREREQNCEICNSSTDVEKTSAPPRIQKGSFFDKIVKEGRQECHLCKNCISTGKGNEPLNDEPTTIKCADCQQDKKPDELTAIQVQGKDLKVCSSCKQKRDNPQDDPNRKPNNPNDDPNKPSPDNEKKYGSDFKELKSQQKEDRKTVDDKWKNEYTKKPDYQRSSLCPYCQKSITYDKSKENFLDAKDQVKSQLEAHKASCEKKGKKSEIKSLLQAKWDEVRESKKRMFKTCKKCWGKVRWDESIEDAERAQKQCQADLNKHKKKECGIKPKKKWTIKVYQSPGQGGDEHAEIPNDLKVEGKIWEEDNQGEVYQKQKNKGLSGGTIALIVIGVIGGIALIGGLIYSLTKSKKKIK